MLLQTITISLSKTALDFTIISQQDSGLSFWLCFRDIIYTTLIADTNSAASILVLIVVVDRKLPCLMKELIREQNRRLHQPPPPLPAEAGSALWYLIVRISERALILLT